MQSVLQLPDIARPIVSLQGFQKSRCDGLSFLKRCRGFQKMLDQQRDILFSFPERGQANGKDMDPVIEIFSNLPRLYPVPQVLV